MPGGSTFILTLVVPRAKAYQHSASDIFMSTSSTSNDGGVQTGVSSKRKSVQPVGHAHAKKSKGGNKQGGDGILAQDEYCDGLLEDAASDCGQRENVDGAEEATISAAEEKVDAAAGTFTGVSGFEEWASGRDGRYWTLLEFSHLGSDGMTFVYKHKGTGDEASVVYGPTGQLYHRGIMAGGNYYNGDDPCCDIAGLKDAKFTADKM
jgi:hypothetical protein